jgi:hypothetical protein
VRLHDAEGNYAAVSYAWGTEQATQVEGKILNIRKNLHELMWSIRASDRPLYLWVDAICIHQASNLEKGHQVDQMASVYRGAKTTHVLLGEPSAPLMDLFQAEHLGIFPGFFLSPCWYLIWQGALLRYWIIQTGNGFGSSRKWLSLAMTRFD